MDFFELGDKTSLICADPATAEAAKTVHCANWASSITLPKRRNWPSNACGTPTYDCIIVHENFAGSSLRSNAVLNYLSPLPMAQRRYSFICLIGPSFKTLDAMQAFAQSVHLVLNPADLANLRPF